MPDTARIQALIHETLNCSRMTSNSPNSCLVWNAAARELEEYGPEALTEIENVIRDRIASESWANHQDLGRKHPGLENLWMTCFSIGGVENTARITRFMRSLDGPVLATAILALRASWPYDEGLNIKMPKPFLDFVHEIAESRTGNAGDVAKHLLRSIYQLKA